MNEHRNGGFPLKSIANYIGFGFALHNTPSPIQEVGEAASSDFQYYPLLSLCATILQMEVKALTPGFDIKSLPHRSEVIQQVKREGKLVAGVLPIHYPRELLRAFNIHPVEIWGPPRIDPTEGVSHVQPYVCSVVRNALAFQQSGGLEIVDVILVPHACDSLQGLGSLFLDFIQPKQPIIPFYFPRSGGDAGTQYLIDELKKLYVHLKVITGTTPSDELLLQATLREEEYDQAFCELLLAHQKINMSSFDFYHLVRSREYLPGEQFLELTKRALSLESGDTRSYVPILISGILPEPMELFQAIEKYGGKVVADDLACCGRRRYLQGKSEDSFTRMAERLLSGPPDWNKGSPIEARLANLIDIVESTGAMGVLFYSVKFCEPELFDLPQLKEGLQNRGIPSLVVEVDINDSLSNQIQTRIEAFMEMLA